MKWIEKAWFWLLGVFCYYRVEPPKDSFVITLWKFHNEVNWDLSREVVHFYPTSIRGETFRHIVSQVRPDTESKIWPDGIKNTERPMTTTYSAEELKIAEDYILKTYSKFI